MLAALGTASYAADGAKAETRSLLVAFPGAEGFGALASGGRGGTLYHVTNLNDRGPGSFRDAVTTERRIVVFNVGGYVNLASPVSIASNITIAGQTAPGEGICLKNYTVSCASRTTSSSGTSACGRASRSSRTRNARSDWASAAT